MRSRNDWAHRRCRSGDSTVRSCSPAQGSPSTTRKRRGATCSRPCCGARPRSGSCTRVAVASSTTRLARTGACSQSAATTAASRSSTWARAPRPLAPGTALRTSATSARSSCPVRDIAFSPDGRELAVGDNDGLRAHARAPGSGDAPCACRADEARRCDRRRGLRPRRPHDRDGRGHHRPRAESPGDARPAAGGGRCRAPPVGADRSGPARRLRARRSEPPRHKRRQPRTAPRRANVPPGARRSAWVDRRQSRRTASRLPSAMTTAACRSSRSAAGGSSPSADGCPVG